MQALIDATFAFVIHNANLPDLLRIGDMRTAIRL
jgi:hypothetical protein